jgi:hypothetical protein
MRVKGKQPTYLRGKLRLQILFLSTVIVLLASLYLYSNLRLDGAKPWPQPGSLLISTSDASSSSTLSVPGAHVRDKDIMDNDKIHIVFSTGCNAFQDCTWKLPFSVCILFFVFYSLQSSDSRVFWYNCLIITGQSYIVFHQIWKVRQTGHVTRIVSGCDADEARALQTTFDQQIRNGIPTGKIRFHLHFTQDYSKIVPDVEYKAHNKPFGVLHWMEHVLKMPDTLPQYANTMFIIIDPDQIIVRPFVSHDFTMTFDPSRWHNYHAETEELRNQAHVLRDGYPIAQLYAMGADFIDPINQGVQRVVDAAWKATKDNPAFTPAMKSSTALYNWTKEEVWRSYVAGPPYIVTALNLYQIAVVWAAVSAPVYELTTDFISEMYSYTTAAAHLGLRHDMSYSFMVSNAGGDWIEAWEEYVDRMPPSDICLQTTTDLNDAANAQYRSKLPFVLHYCQAYTHGNYYFVKYDVSNEFLSCEHPLLADPSEYDAQVRANGAGGTPFLATAFSSDLPESHRKRHVFMLCHLIGRINDAATHWKKTNCAEGTANFSKVYNVNQ